MAGVLYEAGGGWSFVVLTLAIGGATAFLAGQAVAKGWRSPWVLIWYVLLLTMALRFLHFALFDGAFPSLSSAEENRAALQFSTVDFAFLAAMAAVGWRITRARQMTTQYRWLYARSSPFTWKKRVAQSPGARG